MRKCMRAMVVICLLLVTAGVPWAHGRHGGRWWKTAEVVEALKLNDDEIQQLEQAYEASELRMIELKSRVEAERFKLTSVLEKEDLDEAAMNVQYDRLENARAALGKERFSFFVEVRRIIGPDRFHQLMEIYQARREARRQARNEEAPK